MQPDVIRPTSPAGPMGSPRSGGSVVIPHVHGAHTWHALRCEHRLPRRMTDLCARPGRVTFRRSRHPRARARCTNLDLPLPPAHALTHTQNMAHARTQRIATVHACVRACVHAHLRFSKVGGEVVYCDVLPGVQASVKDLWSGLNLCPEVANVLAKHNPSQVDAALCAKSPFVSTTPKFCALHARCRVRERFVAGR